jgi:uncharacterized protein YbjT (DUF2867 family)
VGSALTDQLVEDTRFDKVVLLLRRPPDRKHPKLEVHEVDFDRPEAWKHLVVGDVLFSALGTTLKQAGSKEAQYRVDYTYQFSAAEAASRNGVPSYVLVSSAGASERSFIFYSRMKGSLEHAVRSLPFRKISIIQPGLLTGPRQVPRGGEAIALRLLNVLHHLPGLSGQKPIEGARVAKAMIQAYFRQTEAVQVFSLGQVFELAEGRL